MKRIFNSLVMVGVTMWAYVSSDAAPAELRLIDGAGLVRAIKVVRESARVVITIDTRKGRPQGECVATNVDGLATEKRVAVSPQGECVLQGLTVGSWQIAVPSQAPWRAQIYE